MSYVLFARCEEGTPTVLKEYSTLKGALHGLRVSNRDAGWARSSRCSTGTRHEEWCARSNGTPVYGTGPYAVMNRVDFENHYGLNDLVEVRSLMTKRPVLIPRKDLGTCMDPSTERYWTM